MFDTNPTRAYLTRATIAAMVLALAGAAPISAAIYQAWHGTVHVPVLVGATLGGVALTIAVMLFLTVSGELDHPRAARLHLNLDRWGDQNTLAAVTANLDELRAIMTNLIDAEIGAVTRYGGRRRWTRMLARARAWRTIQWSGRWDTTPGSPVFKTIQVADTLGPAFTDMALATAVADLIDAHDLGVLRLPWTMAGLHAPAHPYTVEVSGGAGWSPLARSPRRVTS